MSRSRRGRTRARRASSSAAPRSSWRSVPRPRRARSGRAAGRRPAAPARALGAIERSAAGNAFFAEELAASVDASGEVTVPPRLREVVARRLEQARPFGERLLAALAVVDDGFTRRGARGTRGRRGRRGARRGRGGGRARVCAGRYRFRHALVREAAGRPAARGGARAPMQRRPRCSRRTTLRPRRSRAICCAPAGRERPCRCSPGLPSGPRAWAPTATAPSGPSWRSSTRTSRAPALLALRAQLLHGAGEARAPPPTPRRSRSRPRSGCPAASAAGARLPRGGRHRAPGRARRGAGRAARGLGELIVLRGMVAWHLGDWDGARRLAAEADRLAPDPASWPT